ncbi:MAG TPA: LysM domain-containing protein [Pirellulales bacterium]|nr:LysM domain-containing protein [Pirellulales bacterium]
MTLSRIAGKVGSTVESLRKLNPSAHLLRPGQKLTYRKAAIRRVITGWNMLNSANLAAKYNVGDPNYNEKLDYVMSLFPKLKR